MVFYIVIPVHNEAQFLARTLDSLIFQTIPPKQIVVVNDASTDATQRIIESYAATYDFVNGVQHHSLPKHEPGSKVIDAFYAGYQFLDRNYDVLCKFDGDLIFPPDYLEILSNTFQSDENTGMAGGFCYIEKNGSWILENLTNKDHIRGALKAYKRECFKQIGGVKNAMGWDTVDELLARYHGWEVKTLPSLQVKHLKPTGKVYNKAAKYKQGEAFYKMRYGFLLTVIASAKLAFSKRSFVFFINCIRGYYQAKRAGVFLVTEKEGHFIRNFRWKNIRSKMRLHQK